MFFGGISGSAVADVSALGTFLIPQMVRKGYDLDFATALTVSTAVVAPIIPPSIIAVIYAWMAEESVAAMFAAGIIPGMLVGAGMAVPVFVIAKKRNYPKEPPPTLPEFMAVLRNALPALMIPVIIMGGILFGLFTPTEAAAVAVVYALVVPPIFYREPALRELPAIFADSARLSGVIGLIIGFVGAFGWVLTYSKFPFKVAEAIAAIARSGGCSSCSSSCSTCMLGTFLTPSEIILVTVPVLLPVAQAAGVHPDPLRHRVRDRLGRRPHHAAGRAVPVRRHGDQRPADGQAGEAAAAVSGGHRRDAAAGRLHSRRSRCSCRASWASCADSPYDEPRPPRVPT